MSINKENIKVLIAKVNLDGHWRGVSMVATALRDAGMEVIWGGRMTAEEITLATVQEDVDVIGLNIGARYGSIVDLMEMLRKQRIEDVVVVVGGTIPPDDIPALRDLGVDGVFPPGSDTDYIAQFIKETVTKKEENKSSVRKD